MSTHMPNPKHIKLFWEKVTKSEGCWLHSSKTILHGYPITKYRPMPQVQITMQASRFAWLVTKGEIPDGLFACHKCDNPKCVNPDHLFLGTHQDNMDDMWAKGRGVIPPEWKEGVRFAQTPEARAKRKATFAKTQHQQGEKNSQYGTCWVCNKETLEVKKIKKESLDEYITKGWVNSTRIKPEKVKKVKLGHCPHLTDAEVLAAWNNAEVQSLRKVAALLGINYTSLRKRLAAITKSMVTVA